MASCTGSLRLEPSRTTQAISFVTRVNSSPNTAQIPGGRQGGRANGSQSGSSGKLTRVFVWCVGVQEIVIEKLNLWLKQSRNGSITTMSVIDNISARAPCNIFDLWVHWERGQVGI